MYNPYAYAPHTDYAMPGSHAGLLNDDAVFYVSDMVQNTVAPVSGMYNPYAYIPHSDFTVPQSHTPMVGGMMPAQHVPFTAYENQPGMYVPVGYNEHMSAGYTMVSSYTAPIVSHEQCVIQDLPHVDSSNFEAVAVQPEPAVELTSTETAEALEEPEVVETAEMSAAAEAQVIISEF